MAKKNRKSGKNKKKGGGVRAKKRPTKSETEEAPTLVTETKTDAANATEAPPSGSASLAARADSPSGGASAHGASSVAAAEPKAGIDGDLFPLAAPHGNQNQNNPGELQASAQVIYPDQLSSVQHQTMDHSEIHSKPSQILSVCDGDESASRSGSEDSAKIHEEDTAATDDNADSYDSVQLPKEEMPREVEQAIAIPASGDISVQVHRVGHMQETTPTSSKSEESMTVADPDISSDLTPRIRPSKLIDNNGNERLPAPSMPQIELGDGAASATVAHSSSGAEAMGNSKTISSSEILPPSVAVATSLGADATIESLDSDSSTDRCIRLGICAMDKKARSKPMGEILSRLDETLFEVVFFGDDLILNGNIEDWPLCDVLIAFYSSGYPLAKAEEYVKLRKPFEVNDLAMQWKLKDRRTVYDLLESSGIDVPRHVYMSRDGYVSTGSGDGEGGNGELIEQDDHVEINSVVINKPFVEKPVDADDHNIAIYYPTSAGGGCKKLFRKVGNRSSEFYPMINEVRRDGSYIYEEFVETQGTDVKMYTVGPDYGHAEARKSPTVDGKVERNSDGKEVRFPVILSLREKEIARRIVIQFKQRVCGFDLLRVEEGDSVVSYVCDVNGWSFVKNSRKYYDDCAQILTEHMLAAVRPSSLTTFSALDPLITKVPDKNGQDVSTPKKPGHRKGPSAIQRVSRMLQRELPEEAANDGSLSPARTDNTESSNQAPTALEEGAIPVSQIPHQLATEPPSIVTSAASSFADDHVEEEAANEPSTHKEELRCVISVIRHGDRTPKQKLKVVMSEPRLLSYYHSHSKNPRKELKVKAKQPLEEFLKTIILMIGEKEAEAKAAGSKRFFSDDVKLFLYKLRHMRDVLQRWKIGGLNRKLQIKPQKWDEIVDEVSNETVVRCTEVLLILKWGGNLTKLGERQAINLGQRLRHDLYPDAPGGGILRLHSTFRHDLKIKTSDEGRVMKTAAASAKGLLELEGEIPPILVSLVHKEKDSIHMLDPSGNKEVKKELEICKSKINENLQKDCDFDETTVSEHEEIGGPIELLSIHKALQEVGNPRKALFAIRNAMGKLLEQLDEMLGLLTSGDESRAEDTKLYESALSAVHIKLYKGETLLELTERWRLLYRKFYDEDSDTFDLSRVPDVHDNVRFDMLHNPHLGLTETLESLYNMAKIMADCVVPQEYGTTILEKRSIGQKMCRALLDKIKYDLIIARTDNEVDMRYMINMDYSADLPINTMGRRVRTRLYFTSESHLHTLLNVLRFTYNDPRSTSSILSNRGRQIVDKNPELCYLTQIIFRLFEYPKKDIDDPKRFRIEVLFSPGATATPLHMAEMDRERDNTRFETDALELISKDSLTCKDVEDYFSECIDQGKTDEDDDDSIISNVATKMEDVKKMKDKQKKENMDTERNLASTTSEDPRAEKDIGSASAISSNLAKPSTKEIPRAIKMQEGGVKEGEISTDIDTVKGLDTRVEPIEMEAGKAIHREANNEEEKIERVARRIEKKYFWASVAAVSFVTGVGLLFLSSSVGPGRTQRRWTSRR